MVNIVKRMRVLRELLWIRSGPGALILPKEVTKISMEFNAKIDGGHRGARKFWREMLPRIKYRNPTIPIQINRHKDPNGPSQLHIFTVQQQEAASSSSQASSASPTHTIDVRMLSESAILDKLLEKTGATVIDPTPEELEQMEEVRQFKEKAEKDRVEVRQKLLKERREQELLKMARGEAAASS